jgi:mycothiol system anti-sigma-R factor
MECTQARALLQAYLDDELDAAAAAQVSSHLQSCSACSAAFEELQSLGSLIAQNGTRYRAPAQLRQRIRASVEGSTGKRPPCRRLSSWPWAWINFGLASAASMAFAVTLGLYLAEPSSDERLSDEIVATHFRSLMSGRLADVASSDQHTVKPWFSGKLDFSPPVVDLGHRGFALVGGRVDYLAGRPVAALAYQHRKHVLNLYVWPSPVAQQSAVHATTRQGFQLMSWTQQQMHFVAISDMSAQDLAEFAKALEAQVAQSGVGG